MMILPYRSSVGDDEELRYALRSFACNTRQSQLMVVGDCPEWLEPDFYIPTKRSTLKFSDVALNLIAAFGFDFLPPEVLLINDDFFVMEQMASFALWHEEPLLHEKVSGMNEGPYKASLEKTAWGLLERRHSTYSFEVHTPMPIKTALMKEALLSSKPGLQLRSWYGNFALQRGEESRAILDPKLRSPQDAARWRGGALISTCPTTWPLMSRLIKARFTQPSPWEKA